MTIMTTPDTEGPVRLEVQFYGGRGYRRRFASLVAATLWLASDEFAATADRVRHLAVTTPHPRYEADPDNASPRSRKRLPYHLGADLPHGLHG